MMNAAQTLAPENKVLSDRQDAGGTATQRANCCEPQMSAALQAAERAFRCAFCQTELKSDSCPTCDENKGRAP